MVARRRKQRGGYKLGTSPDVSKSLIRVLNNITGGKEFTTIDGDNKVSMKLGGRSANCKFTKIVVFNDDNSEDARYFVKFQVDDNADNILVDSLNGAILNILDNKSRVFTEYVDTFKAGLVYCHKTNAWLFPIDKLVNNETVAGAEAKKANVQVDLTNGFSLDYVVLKSVLRPTELDRLVDWLNVVFLKIEDIGLLYGFVHNDCHGGNFMYIPGTSPRIAMIDYGRVMFDDMINDAFKNVDNILDLITEFSSEFGKMTTFDYKPLLKAVTNNVYVENKVVNFVSPFVIGQQIEQAQRQQGKPVEKFVPQYYLFDIATIAMNLVTCPRATAWDLKSKIGGNVSTIRMPQLSKTAKFTSLPTKFNMQSKIYGHVWIIKIDKGILMKATKAHPYAFIVQGIRLFVSYCMVVNKKKKGIIEESEDYIIIDFNKLNTYGYVWTSFQFIDVDMNDYIDTVYTYKTGEFGFKKTVAPTMQPDPQQGQAEPHGFFLEPQEYPSVDHIRTGTPRIGSTSTFSPLTQQSKTSDESTAREHSLLHRAFDALESIPVKNTQSESSTIQGFVAERQDKVSELFEERQNDLEDVRSALQNMGLEGPPTGDVQSVQHIGVSVQNVAKQVQTFKGDNAPASPQAAFPQAEPRPPLVEPHLEIPTLGEFTDLKESLHKAFAEAKSKANGVPVRMYNNLVGEDKMPIKGSLPKKDKINGEVPVNFGRRYGILRWGLCGFQPPKMGGMRGSGPVGVLPRAPSGRAVGVLPPGRALSGRAVAVLPPGRAPSGRPLAPAGAVPPLASVAVRASARPTSALPNPVINPRRRNALSKPLAKGSTEMNIQKNESPPENLARLREFQEFLMKNPAKNNNGRRMNTGQAPPNLKPTGPSEMDPDVEKYFEWMALHIATPPRISADALAKLRDGTAIVPTAGMPPGMGGASKRRMAREAPN